MKTLQQWFRAGLLVLAYCSLALLTLGAVSAEAATTISLFAGGVPTSAQDPLATPMQPYGLAIDSSGNRYIADEANHVIFKIDASTGKASVVAGTGLSGYSGDGGLATSATLNNPMGLAFDSSGNLYIADTINNVIRKVNTSGIISTVAGTGINGFSGDGWSATTAQLYYPKSLAVDGSGNLYIADTFNHVIRKVDSSGNISSVAGIGGSSGYSGDGFAAYLAKLNYPSAVALDSSGNLYIGDTNNCVVRKVVGGNISTFAGNGSCGRAGDGGVATAAQLYYTQGLAIDSSGNVYVSDDYNVVRKIDTSGNINAYAGNGSAGAFAGDGGTATSARLNQPKGIALDSSGNLYIADSYNYRLRKVDTGGNIATVAGTGKVSPLSLPVDVQADNNGNVYIVDSTNNKVLKVSNGVMSVFAGTGTGGSSGDGGQATSAQLNAPAAVAIDSSGNVYIADKGNTRIRKVDSSGIISTVSITSSGGGASDMAMLRGSNSVGITLGQPVGIAVDSNGNLYVADITNSAIRKIDTSGNLTNVAGTGTAGYSGDGGAATAAKLKSPNRVVLDSSGNLYIADTNNNAIRKVTTAGIISTVAGTGVAGYSGDGGAATAAKLNVPKGIAVDGSGNLYIADVNNNVIRKVDTSGTITTVAGTGSTSYSGDGGDATAANINAPQGVGLDKNGNFYIADTGNKKIRKVTGLVSATVSNTPTATSSNTPTGEVPAGGSGGATNGGSVSLTGSGTVTATGGATVNLVPKGDLGGATVVLSKTPTTNSGTTIVFGQQSLIVLPIGNTATLTVINTGGSYLPTLSLGSVSLNVVQAGPILVIYARSGRDGVQTRASSTSSASVLSALTANTNVTASYDDASGITRVSVDSGIVAVGNKRYYAGEVLVFGSTGALSDAYLGSLNNNSGYPGDPLNLSAASTVTVKAAVPRLSGWVAGLNASLDNTLGGKQSSNGQYSLNGFNGLPVGEVKVDRTQGDSNSLTESGLTQISKNGYQISFAPTLADLGDFASQVGGKVMVQSDGVLLVGSGSATYALRPEWTASASNVRSVKQGGNVWTYSNGQQSQTLRAAFANTAGLKTALQAIDSSATVATQADGSVLVGLQGNNITLLPQAQLVAVPTAHQKDTWWQDGSTFYLQVGDGQNAQAFTLK